MTKDLELEELRRCVRDEMEKLSTYQNGTPEHEECAKTIRDLMAIIIESDNDKKNRIANLVSSGIKDVGYVTVSVIATTKFLEFEEEGTISSTPVRNFLNAISFGKRR